MEIQEPGHIYNFYNIKTIQSNLQPITPTASQTEPTTPSDKSKPSERYPSDLSASDPHPLLIFIKQIHM